MDKDCFQFRTEINVFALLHKVKRLDAHAIPRQYEALLRQVPDGEGEHSSQTREAGRIPLEKGLEDGFRVGVRNEGVAQLLQFRSYFQMIIDFAIEDDSPLAIVLENGLIAAFKIDDFQAGGAEGKKIGAENPLLVGTSMDERLHHIANAIMRGPRGLMRETGNATQE